MSNSVSISWSLMAHALIALAVIGVVRLQALHRGPIEEYIDLSYQMFDAPPAEAPVERRLARSPEPVIPVQEKAKPDDTPKELQDEQSDIAGTQKATKENNIGSQNTGDATATPYYKIKPKYPKAALMAGVEGWVMLQIDISETGEVENVRVVDGEQREMFQSEARRAVAQWKYRPFTDDSGHPFKKSDHQVRVDFKLQDI